jgi:hypothetical protein
MGLTEKVIYFPTLFFVVCFLFVFCLFVFLFCCCINDYYDLVILTFHRELEEQLRTNSHQSNMTLVDLERTYTQQKIAFEQELRNKYAQLIAEHQAVTELVQKQTLAQEVEQMQSKMQLEQDRTRVWEEVEKKCRAEYQQQYTQLLADVEAHWKKDAGTREARVHAQLKQHYETLITTKQQQVIIQCAALSRLLSNGFFRSICLCN